eukprot:3058988-Heterocapsa_arctica.AAC.1
MEDPVPVTALATPCSSVACPVPVTALALPCQQVVPRRKPKDKPPRTVVRVDGGNNITDWTSYAMARYRAIELANGDGLLSDPTDVEPWRGVDPVHPKECRRPPLVWESGAVTSFVPDPDGHASYGRVHWH